MSEVFDLDRYVEYYTEKLWAMIPEVYRTEDGLALSPGVLRAIVQTWAKQAAALRRSQDRTWEDLFIELCSQWAIPYIGDLVATRLVSAQNPRGQRIDVAKTIYYRRRAGTVRVLEELISDLTAWEGVVVEGWKTLGRTFHRLDLPPVPRGRLTPTPPGGIADLRRADSTRLVGGPFDEFYYTPDVRRTAPYGISKIGFHLFRLLAVKLRGVDPRPMGGAPDGQGYTFDPSGRDVPLFSRRTRPERWDEWHSALEYELPAPIPCRLLAEAVYRFSSADVDDIAAETGLAAAAADDLRTMANARFDAEWKLRQRLAMQPNSAALLTEPVYQAILRIAAEPDCGKHHLLPDSVTVYEDFANNVVAPNESTAAANLSGWASNATFKRTLIDPERGRLLVYDPAPADVRVDYHVGVYMAFGAGGFPRNFTETPDNAFSGGGAALNALPNAGVTMIDDSRTYTPVGDVAGITEMTLAAADLARPYLRLNADWALTSAAPAPNVEDGVLTLDGLWLGAEGAPRALVLDGDYESVTLRYCTLDPGGVDADGNPIEPVSLVIRGFVEMLTIDHCALGPVRLDGGSVESVIIRDSTLQSRDENTPALVLNTGMVDMARTTVLGSVDVLRLYATDCLIAGLVDVTDTQEGCFRFSAAVAIGEAGGSRVPRPYESVSLTAGEVGGLFVSRDYGQPGYAMLRLVAPATIARGGEDGAEMGVYSGALAPYKVDGLNAKIAEFMPFGLIPVFVYHT
ncbi:MAG: hypothetical protein IPK19_00920 [Chloroflexi bacterium]|nr:hypothetical protein [Chloroflexota bacterium]